MKKLINKIMCNFSGHHKRLLGHTQEKPEFITVYSECIRCGCSLVADFLPNDPEIDEDSSMKHVSYKQWSGYSWWLHKPLSDDRVKQIKEKLVLK
jgi:hypothetical protein